MGRLLTICPSRIRPERILEMLESWDKTRSPWNDIIIYVADDDPRLPDYRKNLKGRNFYVGRRRTLVEANNFCACDLYQGYDYYHEINDDHIYHTSHWDEKLIEDIERMGGWGISFGVDIIPHPSWAESRYPTGTVISGNIVRLLGYFISPLFHHHQADGFLRDIGEGIDKYYRDTNVIIEHRHPTPGHPLYDENYAFSCGAEEISFGNKAYAEWCSLHKDSDIQKIRDAMNG
jgi:hypothetical protein